jgi:Kdo2-lipid IVA lauroyltransferase/acyltransferase
MKNPVLKKIRNYLFFLLLQLIRSVVFFIPWKAGRKSGEMIGAAAFHLLKNEVRKVYRNLDIVYGDKMTSAEKEKFALENFKHYGIGLFEFMKASLWSPEKTASLITEVEGFEYFEQAVKAGKSVIAVTAHTGNWELMPGYVKQRIPVVGVIGKKIFDERLDRIVNATRRKSGVLLFDRDKVSKEMIKGLRRGMIMGILVDQDTSVDSVIAPFLGRDAKTPVAPAKLAKKFNAVICTGMIFRREDGYYKFIINKPYDLTGKETDEEIAARYNNEISEMILKYPTQWVWVHERWKSTVI